MREIQTPSQEIMQQASFNPATYPYHYPFIQYDEVFVQVSPILPIVRDYYWISNYGKLYNANNGYLATPTFNKDGYVIYSMMKKEKVPGSSASYNCLAHVLVALAFLPPKPSEEYQVNHKNCVRHDNWVGNLEWMTHADNLQYSRDMKNYWNEDGTYKSHVYAKEDVEKICSLLQRGITNPTQLSMEVFGTSATPGIYSLIRSIKSGKNWGFVSEGYKIPGVEHRNFISDEFIHSVCRLFQDNPQSLCWDTPTIVNAIGNRYDTFSSDMKNRFRSAIYQIKNKKAYARIVSNYNF